MLKAVKTQNTLLAELTQRVDRLEQDLQATSRAMQKLVARTRHLGPGVQALLRRVAVDADALPYPERLTARRCRLASQNEEDGVTLELFRRIGAESRRFVELGCGVSGGNSAVLALELGWTGLMVDADAGRMARVRRRFPGVAVEAAWITAESVNPLIERHGLAGEIDLLSIDVDGNDYWVWQAITACSPRVVIVEYNSIFGPDRAVTIPYDPQFDRRKHRFIYYGASLAALACLAKRKGYRLVATASGVDAYFLRHDVAPDIPEVAPRRAYRLLPKYDLLIRDKQLDVYAWIAEESLPLVEVD